MNAPTLPDLDIYNRKQAARMLKKSVKTLYRWESLGIFVPKRSRARGAYYTMEQIREFLNMPENGDPR